MALACSKRQTMGFDFGLQRSKLCIKQRNHWLFQIEGVSATINALPPLKAHRPNLEFKEQQISHLVQSIYYPVSVEWKPITLTLFDIKKNSNPVFDWIRAMYNPAGGDQTGPEWKPVYDPNCTDGTCFKRNGLLCVYDGCGAVVEKWRYENCYPQAVNWGDLDMSSTEVITVEVTLRYDRAYLEN